MQHARESPNSAVFCASGLPVSRYMPSNAQRVAGKHRQPYRCLSLAKFKFMSSPVPQHRTTSSRFQAQNNTPADLITGWRYAVSLLKYPENIIICHQPPTILSRSPSYPYRYSRTDLPPSSERAPPKYISSEPKQLHRLLLPIARSGT